MKPLTSDQEKRFWSKVKKAESCWVWVGSLTTRGYGQYHPSHMQRTTAHRWSWMIAYGEIPRGLQVRHKCQNKRCVNPSHLELITPKAHKALHPTRMFGRDNPQGRKSHCPQGHPYDEQNTGISRQGKRYCKTCKRIKARTYTPY